jgi:HSP20 family molecular chaperone IbpA
MEKAKDTERTRELEVQGKEAVARESTRPGPVFRPEVDILEQPDAYLVYADLPGADEKSVEVRLEKGVLSLEARQAFATEAGWTLVHREYEAGGYQREFSLSEDVDADAIAASLRDGVLELRLPKTRQHRPRTIEIQAG